jgi:Flp pilus assembly protein TadB
MNGCCGNSTSEPDTASRGAVEHARRLRDLAGWIAPGAALAMVPKCPACIAAYIALATGVGVSMTAAAYIRFALISVCVAALAFVAARRFTRVTQSSHPLLNRAN